MKPAGTLRRAALPVLYLAGLAWVNAYICREIFWIEHTGYMNSMHGFWMGLARLAPPDHWLRSAWWLYGFGGMPFEYAYTPLIPDLMAALSKAAGVSVGRAFHVVSGFFYCLGPLVMFVVALRFTRAPGYSFAAALAYSLLSPTELLIPDARFHWASLASARRMYLAFVWDETPHLASLCFALLAVLFFSLSLRKRRLPFDVLAGVFLAASVLANAFGGVVVLMGFLSLVFALGTGMRSNMLRGLTIGGITYVVMSPLFPPSLVETIRANAHRLDGGWTPGSLATFAAVAFGWLLLWRLVRRFDDWALRFFALFAYLTSTTPLLAAYVGRHFLPQPARYKIEMEMALIFLVVFALRPALKKLDARIRVGLVLVLVTLAAQQVVSHRRFAKNILRSVPITETVEYQVARWTQAHLPGQRVMMPGSIGQWLNAFGDSPQFAGGSFPTAPNWTQQVALDNVYRGRDGREAALWLRAYGVQAVAVSGPRSREFWKPYTNPEKFEGLLPLLWQEEDLTIYRVSGKAASLAHVIPAASVVSRPPRDGQDLAEVAPYVAALDDPVRPAAQVHWDGFNRARILATFRPGDVLSVQVNYHPGWRATANGSPVRVARDGLGQMFIEPRREGSLDVDLLYDGGWELKLCRALSALTLAGLALWLFSTIRSKP